MNFLRKLQLYIRWTLLTLFGLSIFLVILYRYVPVYVTPLMVKRCAQQVWHGEQIRLKHHWVPLDTMSKYMPVAVIASEDEKYLNHHGFDFDAIKMAYEDGKKGKRQRGGSTISQQTAKNVFTWCSSTYLRKGIETYFTCLIELCWSKHRIMEVYLNSIEMGDGIYGAEAVAQQHFGCPASDLSRPNCALVAATLPNPLLFDSSAPSNYMLRRQTAIMRKMRAVDLFPKEDEE